MALPDDLLRAAALGTEQRADYTDASSGLGNVAYQNMSSQPETQLLLKVVTLKLQQQAGYQPYHGAIEQYPPALIDEAVPCNGRAVRHLLLMITESKHANLLPVWLNEMKETRQRLPDEVLPLLLTHGNTRNQLRDKLLPVIGERGKWLARISNNEQWRWVFDKDNRYEELDETTFWKVYLRRYRERDPHRAGTLLEAYWSQLDETKQQKLFDEMKYGLSKRDETFLIQLLDDETLGISAARMLCSIKESDFGREMRQAVERMLVLTRMGHRENWVIDFVWSSAFEGQPTHRPRSYAAEVMHSFKNRWTPEQMLSFVPLSYWYERWQITPDILVEGGRNSTQPTAILEAWTRAAVFEDDNHFAYQLLRQINPNRLKAKGRELLISLLTTEQKEEIGIFWLDQIRQGIHENHPAKPIVEEVKRRWSEELMLAFLASLERSFTNTVRPLLKSSIRLLIEQVVTHFSLEMIDEVKRVLKLNKRPELSESELEVIDGIVSVLEFQQEMIRAIRNREA